MAGTTTIALTIAGSDSGGGAGIQADLKTFHAFGVFGTTAITAITAQNTVGVTAWEPVSPALVRAQIDAVVKDLPPGAVKTGMLGDTAIVETVADALRAALIRAYVCDPVLVATSGDVLARSGVLQAIREQLIPLAALITPNLDEAQLLLDERITDVAGMEHAARRFVRDLGASAALVKGGHLEGEQAVDVLYDGNQMHRLARPRIATRHTHGTGCTLSAAITARLARGDDLVTSVRAGVSFVTRAIASAPGLGAGNGPLDFFVEA